MRWYTQEEVEQWRTATGADKVQLPPDCKGLWYPDIGAWVRSDAGIGKIDDRDESAVEVFFPISRSIESCPVQALQPLRPPNEPQFVIGDAVLNSAGEFLIRSIDNRSSYLGFIAFLEDANGAFHNSQNCTLIRPLELTQLGADVQAPLPLSHSVEEPNVGPPQMELMKAQAQPCCPRCGQPPGDPDAVADRFCRSCGDFFAYLR